MRNYKKTGCKIPPQKPATKTITPKNMTNKVQRKTFFDQVKKVGLFKRLSQSQVDGLNFMLDAWDKSGLTDKRWLAYMLATAYHEVDRKMIPIREYGRGRGRTYGSKIKMSRVRYKKPNQIYYGRGYVQLTWFENYEVMGKLLKLDLLNKPDLALDPTNGMNIMIEGMTTGLSLRGDFTGHSLEKYFNDKVNDPYGARRIINGRDKASMIAGYHKKFVKCL